MKALGRLYPKSFESKSFRSSVHMQIVAQSGAKAQPDASTDCAVRNRFSARLFNNRKTTCTLQRSDGTNKRSHSFAQFPRLWQFNFHFLIVSSEKFNGQDDSICHDLFTELMPLFPLFFPPEKTSPPSLFRPEASK
jgi:hypothetical protein